MALLPELRRRRYRNRERDPAYDFTLPVGAPAPGVSAMVRVRNEAAKIDLCLRSILPLFDEVVVIDNASEDATVAIVRGLMQSAPHGERIKLWSYPFRLARFGPEHAATPADSLHSAVYFTNWSLSRCGHRFVCKWDGDMVLVRAAAHSFRALLERVRRRGLGCWTLAGQTVYRTPDGAAFLAVGEVNREVELFPTGRGYRFVKDPHWERLSRPTFPRKRHFSPVAFYEVKDVAEDEFAHWSTTAWPSERKQREWRNFQAVKSGRTDPASFRALPEGFLESEAG
ncbi:MAG: glycosyltransferase family 2 protein [Gemmatimonadales bacterium]